MIAKKYRLIEKDFRKVLSKRKPFFSYGIVANIADNTLGHARIGILLSGKHAPGSVNRNAWKRLIYDLSATYLESTSTDIVFAPKKGPPLDHKNEEMRKKVSEDILFLWKTLIKK